ncbi:MAG: DUF3991 and toprim domain-containing protein, partial [Opitutaceae bacterium]
SEIDHLKESVSCATILERIGGWQLDARESTRRALKYRRGKAEILIVNHDQRGWWNPLGEERGDCFALVQYLRPDLNFGQARCVLRALAGIAPPLLAAASRRRRASPLRSASARWAVADRLSPAGPAWKYLVDERCIPAPILASAAGQDVVRQGGYGTPWFAHRDHAGRLTGIEARGPSYCGFLRGGTKSLFRFRPNSAEEPTRVAVLEAPIDALSLAAIEIAAVSGLAPQTLYVATSGGFGAGTDAALERIFTELTGLGGKVMIATDNDAAGDRLADRIEALARKRGVRVEKARPPKRFNDWNDYLRAVARQASAAQRE